MRPARRLINTQSVYTTINRLLGSGAGVYSVGQCQQCESKQRAQEIPSQRALEWSVKRANWSLDLRPARNMYFSGAFSDGPFQALAPIWPPEDCGHRTTFAAQRRLEITKNLGAQGPLRRIAEVDQLLAASYIPAVETLNKLVDYICLGEVKEVLQLERPELRRFYDILIRPHRPASESTWRVADLEAHDERTRSTGRSRLNRHHTQRLQEGQ